jgi:hypothetical protein
MGLDLDTSSATTRRAESCDVYSGPLGRGPFHPGKPDVGINIGLPTDEGYRLIKMINCYFMTFLVLSTGCLTW